MMNRGPNNKRLSLFTIWIYLPKMKMGSRPVNWTTCPLKIDTQAFTSPHTIETKPIFQIPKPHAMNDWK